MSENETNEAGDVRGSHHDLTLASTGSHGCWSFCSCGWRSRTFTSVVGAHLAFGEHLTKADAALAAIREQIGEVGR